jgi:hypothetical protein
MTKNVKIAIIIALVVVGVGVGLYLYDKNKKSKTAKKASGGSGGVPVPEPAKKPAKLSQAEYDAVTKFNADLLKAGIGSSVVNEIFELAQQDNAGTFTGIYNAAAQYAEAWRKENNAEAVKAWDDFYLTYNDLKQKQILSNVK